MSKLISWIDRRFYPRFAGYWDDWLFREAVSRYVDGNTRLLDIGAGAGILPQTNFRGLAREVVGIDLDERVLVNPHLDRGIVANCESIPLPAEYFDVVMADNLLEHLARPEIVFREICRVLKPGGVFVAKTPNKWHYMPTIARLTPLAFHQWFNALRGRESEDTFPTLYRANSRANLRNLAQLAGLQVRTVDLVEGRPEYLRLLAPLYLVGLLYERVVNSTAWLAQLRILLLIELVKPPKV